MKIVLRCHTRSSVRALPFSKQRGFGWGPALSYGPNLLRGAQGWHLRNACAHASVPTPSSLGAKIPCHRAMMSDNQTCDGAKFRGTDSMPQSSNNGSQMSDSQTCDHVKLSKMKTVLRVPYLKLCKGRFFFSFLKQRGLGGDPL